MNTKLRKFISIAGYIIIFIILFFPVGFPAIIGTSFENIIGNNFVECSGGWFCFNSPNTSGWLLVLGIYLLIFVLLRLTISMVRDGRVGKLIGVIIFVIPFLVFSYSLYFLGDSDNLSPLRCSIVRDGKSILNKSRCFNALGTGYPRGINPNEAYCSMVPDESVRDGCYARVAFLKRNPDLCKFIQNEKSKTRICLVPTSKFLSEKECNNQIDQVAKNACYLSASKKEVSGDLTLCRLISDPQTKKDCYEQVLTYGGSIFSCSELNTPSLISECNDIVARARGIMNGCYRIEVPSERISCYESVIERAKQDTED